MSAWKRVALEKLPEYKRLITSAGSPMELWVELNCHFFDACKAGQDDLVGRFYQYARWCLRSPGKGLELSEAGTAAVCGFYEHLPRDVIARRDLRRWITRTEFNDLRAAFQYLLTESEFGELEAEFLGVPPGGPSRKGG
jgi:hypothetical protein